MAGTREMDGRGFARTLMMLLAAFLIVFGTGAVFVRVTKAVQNARGIESGSAALAESNANVMEEPIIEAPPSDIPIYKGGSLASGRESNGGWAYEFMFPLGSLEEIRSFYDTEMTKTGWQKFAGGSEVSVFIKSEQQRKASLNFKYYGGKVRLRLLTSK